jgi:hypothetical protein
VLIGNHLSNQQSASASITSPNCPSRILNEEIEHEAWFIELLSRERDGKGIPSGHFRRGQPGDAPYSKNRGFYNPSRLRALGCGLGAREPGAQ